MTSSTSHSEGAPASSAPPPPGAGSKLVAWALAALAPVLLVGGYLWLLQPPEDAASLSEAAVEMDAELAEAGELEVLLVGSSHLGRGVDTKQLAKALGVEPATVHALWRSNIQAPHWYAMLSNRVYGDAPEGPPVVVVVSTMRRMMQTHVEPGMREASLIEQMGEHEPVINRIVYGRETSSGDWGLVKVRRNKLRERLLDFIRAGSTAHLFVDEADVPADMTRLAYADQVSSEAMERLLRGENARDMTLVSRVIPIVEQERNRSEDEQALADVADTFIPAFIDLVNDKGGRLVFVELPVSPRVARHHAVPPETRRAFIETLNAGGAGFVDLHDMDVEQTHFRDLTHLNKKGMRLVTAELGERLAAMGVLSADPLPETELSLELLVRPTFRRDGTPPPIEVVSVERDKGACAVRMKLGGGEALSEPKLRSMGVVPVSPVLVFERGEPLTPFSPPSDFMGDECKGASWYAGVGLRFTAREPVPEGDPLDRWTAAYAPQVPIETKNGDRHWLFPGTAVVLDMPGEASLGEAQAEVEVEVVARMVGEGALPVLRVAGGEPVPMTRNGSLVTATTTAKPGAEQWAIRVEAPADGAFALLANLRVSSPLGAAEYVGDDLDEAWRSEVRALTRAGQWAVKFKTTPPKVPGFDKPPKKVTEHAARVSVPALAALATKQINNKLGVPFVSPLRVVEDGVTLPDRPGGCLAAKKKGGGVWCHHDERLFLSTADGSNPAENGRSYGLALIDERFAAGGWWIYPGDRLLGPVTPARLNGIPGRVHWLVVEGWFFGDAADSRATLELFIDDQRVWSAPLSAADLEDSRHELALPDDVDLRAGRRASFRVLTEKGDAFFWLKNITLGHDRRRGD